MFYRNNHPDILYHGGQEPLIHLVTDLQQVILWATQNSKRWVFTDSNAGSYYFNDYNDLSQLNRINWTAVNAASWQGQQEQKQAEFLVEKKLPWELIENIGVYSIKQQHDVHQVFCLSNHQPPVQVKRNWYY